MQVTVTGLSVIPVTGDGNCLFHALGYLDHHDGGALRHEVAEFMEEAACNQAGFEGAWLDEAEELRQGIWGGHTAITAYSLLKQVRVEMHTRKPDGTIQITDASHASVGEDMGLPLRRVLYSNENHYDALVELPDPQGYEPAWEQPSPPTYFKEATKPSPKAQEFPPLSAASGPKTRKQARFTQPRPGKKQVQKPKAKQQQATQSPDAKQPAVPPPPEPHPVPRRLRGKQAPPPELQDDILTELCRFPIMAKTNHPHRKQEDLIKDSLKFTAYMETYMPL